VTTITGSGVGEFGRIRRYFAPLAAGFPGALNLADDAALIDVPNGERLVVTTDAMVAGVHFIGDEPADSIGRKALRVNLSDLAAMGATPVAYSLAMILPKSIGDDWVDGFAAGLAADQKEFAIALSGGDSVATPGPMTISITAFGRVGRNYLSRSGAKAGDNIYVSGSIGDAALGLDILQGRLSLPSHEAALLIDRYQLPRPRLGLGKALVGVATGALDISDGLMADLSHLAAESGLAARIEAASVPVSSGGRAAMALNRAATRSRLLSGGDDYELLFTASPTSHYKVMEIGSTQGVVVTLIGKMIEGRGVVALAEDGSDVTPDVLGYRHG
jgi:thiamine-monophosphate kinase